MRQLIEVLCNDACDGRRPGTAGGRLARSVVMAAMREAGLDPYEQPVPACNGANVLAKIRGDVDRWILVAAHFDHLGRIGKDVFRGADDNAAAVAVLVEVGRAIARERGNGRGVIIAAFDGEEPPWFLSGSTEFVRQNRDAIDFMICMDLVGHRFGSDLVPDEVGASLFALGGERSAGTGALVKSLARTERDLIVRPMDAELIPPLSDYGPFWDERIPFLFLSAGRSRVYHTPDDTPDHLDYGKIAATARWLATFTRVSCAREVMPFVDAEPAIAGTRTELVEVVRALAPYAPAETSAALAFLARATSREELRGIVEMLEARLG